MRVTVWSSVFNSPSQRAMTAEARQLPTRFTVVRATLPHNCARLSGFTGIRIEVDRGGGTWTFLDIDTKPHHEDAASPAAGATVLWKYRAIYLDGDQVFGQWSDVGSIAVTG